MPLHLHDSTTWKRSSNWLLFNIKHACQSSSSVTSWDRFHQTCCWQGFDHHTGWALPWWLGQSCQLLLVLPRTTKDFCWQDSSWELQKPHTILELCTCSVVSTRGRSWPQEFQSFTLEWVLTEVSQGHTANTNKNILATAFAGLIAIGKS